MYDDRGGYGRIGLELKVRFIQIRDRTSAKAETPTKRKGLKNC